MEDLLKQDTGQFNLVMGDNGIGKSRFLEGYRNRYPNPKKVYSDEVISGIFETMGPFRPVQRVPFPEGIALSENVKMMGGGERHLFDILAGMVLPGPGDTICIENMGVSIHFRRLPAFWRIVLDTADRMGVTFFATVYSLEVAQHFAKALAGDEMADLRDRARTITLYRTKAGAVKARVREYEEFSQYLKEGYNIMGGG